MRLPAFKVRLYWIEFKPIAFIYILSLSDGVEVCTACFTVFVWFSVTDVVHKLLRLFIYPPLHESKIACTTPPARGQGSARIVAVQHSRSDSASRLKKRKKTSSLVAFFVVLRSVAV